MASIIFQPTYKAAQSHFGNSTDNEQREERIQEFEGILTTDNPAEVVATNTKSGPEDMEYLMSLGQHLCEDKPLPACREHVEHWQNLAVRARNLYTADPTRVVFSEWRVSLHCLQAE